MFKLFLFFLLSSNTLLAQDNYNPKWSCSWNLLGESDQCILERLQFIRATNSAKLHEECNKVAINNFSNWLEKNLKENPKKLGLRFNSLGVNSSNDYNPVMKADQFNVYYTIVFYDKKNSKRTSTFSYSMIGGAEGITDLDIKEAKEHDLYTAKMSLNWEKGIFFTDSGEELIIRLDIDNGDKKNLVIPKSLVTTSCKKEFNVSVNHGLFSSKKTSDKNINEAARGTTKSVDVHETELNSDTSKTKMH